MTFLLPMAAHLGDRHAFDADTDQGVLNGFKLVRLNNCFEFGHLDSSFA